jgi:hypothetical protein
MEYQLIGEELSARSTFSDAVKGLGPDGVETGAGGDVTLATTAAAAFASGKNQISKMPRFVLNQAAPFWP